MILTHKIEIKPNKTCIKLINQYFGYSRYCYNRGLAMWKDKYKNGEKVNSRLIRDEMKKNKELWEKDYSPMVLDTSIEDLDKAFKMFFKKKAKYPKFKSKHNQKDTCRFYRKNNLSIRIINEKLFLPKFPYGIKMTEQIRFNGIIKSCTIKKEANKYFACFTIELLSNTFEKINNKSIVGIDVGIKKFAVCAYGTSKNRKYKEFKSIIKKLKPLYEKISYYQKCLSRKQKNSNKYLVMKTKLQKLYRRIHNIQNDYLNKISTKIIKRFKYIVIEDLNVKGILKNRKLSKVISRSLFYTFKQKLEYKSKIYGNIIIKADKFFPSTQKCSFCGYIRKKDNKLKLSNRTYICPCCGTIEDRDKNAAYNLKLYGSTMLGL